MDRSGDGWDQRLYWERHAEAADAADPVGPPPVGPPPVGPPLSEPSRPVTRRRPSWLPERVTFAAADPAVEADTASASSSAPSSGLAEDAPNVARAVATDGTDTEPLPASGGGGRSLRSRLIGAGATTVLVVVVATVIAVVSRPDQASTADPGRPILPVEESGFNLPAGTDGATASGTPGATVSMGASAGGPQGSAPSSPQSSASASAGVTSTIVTAPVAGQVVRLVNYRTGGYIGVSGNSSANGAAVVQTFNATASSTRWRLQSPGPAQPGCFVLVRDGSNKALDPTDWGTENGTPLQLWAADGTSKQTWCFQAVRGGTWFSLQNQFAFALLDLTDGSDDEAAAIQLWAADALLPNDHQTWRLVLA